MWCGKPGHFPVRIQSARWSLVYSIRFCCKNVPTTRDVDVMSSFMLPQIVAEDLFATEPHDEEDNQLHRSEGARAAFATSPEGERSAGGVEHGREQDKLIERADQVRVSMPHP